MIGTLIVTHGGLAAELLAAAHTIGGAPVDFEALSLDWAEGFEESRAKIARVVERLDTGEGVLILTDMFGDTPSNAALSLAVPGRVEVLTGVNLPMVVRLSCEVQRRGAVGELARWLQAQGRAAIRRGDETAIEGGGGG